MALIVLQYDAPDDPAKLKEYSLWVANEALPSILKADGVKEMRAYRNFSKGSPEITVEIEFSEVNQAISFMGTDAWSSLMAKCRSFGINALVVNVMVPSPLIPTPLTPGSS